jgi:hypothetical protein
MEVLCDFRIWRFSAIFFAATRYMAGADLRAAKPQKSSGFWRKTGVDEQMVCLIVQDGGLHYHCRTMGFEFAD